MPKKAAGDEEDFSKGGKAKAQKAAAQADKEAAASAKKAAEESKAWEDGANKRALGKKAEEAAKKEEAERRKKEAAELLAKEEEAATAQKLRGAEKVAARRALETNKKHEEKERIAAPSLEARGIDAAIAVLAVATGDLAVSGSGDGDSHAADTEAAAKLTKQMKTGINEDDAHPEKRMKAAFKRFEERVLAELKEEYPSLRRSQLNEMVFRKWERSEENPLRMARLNKG